ncbi:serine/threonine-protein phosphatase 4 regulatory subunit 1-like isoform X3 [Pseudomyrmex gracilis]|nr:serine/threonine-protein phosphatase 4 regulatory subunit 1-like isoform X3 [Pseudomyrmex gracilis]XP_020300025.1 serine/threonine-protein phosphatase 4 regulatory subunit 1-like isoform X3 [Pseudomyrmex gracilis]
MVGRIMVEIFREAASRNVTLPLGEIMPIVQGLAYDPDSLVRMELVEQIPNVATICYETPHLFGNVLQNYLLGIIIKYLSDSDNQVRQMAQEALMTVVKRDLLDERTIENEICIAIEHLSYTSRDEHLRNANISLMCRLAPLIGSELTEKYFLRRYLYLCDDNDMMVRRTCATHFGEMCIAVGKEKLFDELIPTFVDLCDDRMWNVRKACVEVMMPVSCCITPEHRRSLLTDILAKHLTDESKWVRLSAFQILGPFISTFAKQFTDVIYNKNGELVYTGQQDNFSLRYSYDGIFVKGTLMSHTLMLADNMESKDLLVSSAIRNDKYDREMRYIMKDSSISLERNDYQEEETLKTQETENGKFSEKTSKHKDSPSKHDTDDTEKYSPFLYYYIPPEIPLDDELIHAARQSAMNRNNAEKAIKQDCTSEANDSSDSSKSLCRIVKCGQMCWWTNDDIINKKKESKIDQQLSVAKQNKETDGDNDDDCLSSLYGDATSSLNDTRELLPTMNFDTYSNIDFTDKSDESCNLSKNMKDNEQNIVPQILINYFVSMADPEQCVEMGADIPRHCAFSFPAVTLTLGRENWQCLKTAYQSLSSAKHWKVRRTLASSIHEIAMILGEELTATDLVPIYDGFIKDLDEVRIGVLKHLAIFLRILKPVDRSQYLPRLSHFLATDNEWNWRFREELAKQLLEIVTLFSPDQVAKNIAPLSLQLLDDKVAAVRHIALELVTRIMCYLRTEDVLIIALIQELREFLVLNAKKWTHRQTYALVCAHLIRNNAIDGSKFVKEMLPCLLSLSCDKVPNIRLAVARTLKKDVSAMGLDTLGIEKLNEVERILVNMRVDADRDVRVLAGGKEQLDILSQCSSDENNQVEQAQNILF